MKLDEVTRSVNSYPEGLLSTTERGGASAIGRTGAIVRNEEYQKIFIHSTCFVGIYHLNADLFTSALTTWVYYLFDAPIKHHDRLREVSSLDRQLIQQSSLLGVDVVIDFCMGLGECCLPKKGYAYQ
jgi:hypothetical protein